MTTSSLPLLAALVTVSLPALRSQTPAPTTDANAAHELRYGKQRQHRAASLVARTWNPDDARPTCKVYHHIYAPDGTLLTKGEGGQFEHHRGLFVGWNKTKWNKQGFDFWHLKKGESQRWVGALEPKELGLAEGSSVHHIQWCAQDSTVVVDERRGLSILAHDDDSYTMLLRIECRAPNGDVHLGGDPQHAGQQFRALQRYAEKGAEPVRYVRPESAEQHKNDVWTNCDWIAQVQPLPNGPVTILRIESPKNPGKTTWSTRPYGRFGATRTFDVTKDKPLRIDQVYVVAMGEKDRAWCEAQAKQWRKAPLLNGKAD